MMVLLRLIFISFCFHDLFSEINVVGLPSPILNYDFLYSSCIGKVFIDSSYQYVGNLSSNRVSCPSSNGLYEGSRVVSQKPVTRLQLALRSGDFSVEFWVRPNVVTNSPVVLLSVDSTIPQCSNNLEVPAKLSLNYGILKGFMHRYSKIISIKPPTQQVLNLEVLKF